MEEEHPAARGDAPRTYVGDEACHRFAGVDRIEQQVAGSAVESAGVGDALFELGVDVHPEPASPGRGEADEVRLPGCGTGLAGEPGSFVGV